MTARASAGNSRSPSDQKPRQRGRGDAGAHVGHQRFRTKDDEDRSAGEKPPQKQRSPGDFFAALREEAGEDAADAGDAAVDGQEERGGCSDESASQKSNT